MITSHYLNLTAVSRARQLTLVNLHGGLVTDDWKRKEH